MGITAVDRSPVNTIDVQLHYDYVSQMAFVSCAIFNGTLPLRYANREAAAIAARHVVVRVAQERTCLKQPAILIWHR